MKANAVRFAAGLALVAFAVPFPATRPRRQSRRGTIKARHSCQIRPRQSLGRKNAGAEMAYCRRAEPGHKPPHNRPLHP